MSCASSNKNDPYETWNRSTFKMNQKVDTKVLRPVAVFYVDYIPRPIRSTVVNFFNNLRDFVNLSNDILQFKYIAVMHDIMRISINTTFGMIGTVDIATHLGLMAEKNTFGKTLKMYGWSSSGYFMIPFLGPSTVRDAIGMLVDTWSNPVWYLFPGDYYLSAGLFVVNAINTRSQYLNFDKLVYDSFDPYITMRDMYLQSHQELNESSGYSIDDLINESS